MVKHPCVGVCSTTVGDDVCIGCGRTVQEIYDWLGMSDRQKLKTLERCDQRLNLLRLGRGKEIVLEDR